MKLADKPCKRCLLRDAYPEDYEKYVASVLRTLPAARVASETVREARLRACRGCDQLNNGTCMGCGCLVEIRAAQKGMKCPFDRWPKA